MAVIEIAGESRVRPTASGRTCFAIMLEEDNHSARVIAYHTDDLLAEAIGLGHRVSYLTIYLVASEIQLVEFIRAW
jgi:hypothetical protein